MICCEQTNLPFASSSIFKCYVFVTLFAIALTQAGLSDAKRPKTNLISENERFVLPENTRGRRQTLNFGTNFSPDLVQLDFDDDYTDNTESEFEVRSCPFRCRCSPDGEDVACAFLSLTTVPTVSSPNLSKLSLAYNKLTVLLPNTFSEYSNSLKILSLQSNHLRKLDEAFSNLTHLEVLRLNWNKLTAIRKTTFSDLINLKSLYLNNNRISFFHPQALRGLLSLELLSLDGNRLFQLHPDTFVTLQFNEYFK